MVKISLDSVRTVRSKRAASMRSDCSATARIQSSTIDTTLIKLVVTPLLITTATLPARRPLPPLPWALPVRGTVTTAVVLLITSVAPTLGPYGSALLATFPLFASVLAVFAERHQGHAAAVDVLRGLVNGLFGFT